MIATSGRPIVLAINDATMAGEARRAAVALAGCLGFDETCLLYTSPSPRD